MRLNCSIAFMYYDKYESIIMDMPVIENGSHLHGDNKLFNNCLFVENLHWLLWTWIPFSSIAYS